MQRKDLPGRVEDFCHSQHLRRGLVSFLKDMLVQPKAMG